MALQGKFIINNADYSPLTFYGIGTFLAFSGNGIYRNRSGCKALPDEGPIPPGKYWILDRKKNDFWHSIIPGIKDWYSDAFKDAQFTHDDWFSLYRDDGGIDDSTWIDGVPRSSFRLHPGTISKGCITVVHNSDYAIIRNALLRTQRVPVPCMRNLSAYGYIEVIADGKMCP
ncbi:DUF2778 domain-containing protein [Siccibacter turicensis]|uniref:Tlde1 domain-containing protein n=1 Tax=Siccibacter turicensis TaxID=357233 RepID=A0A2P8VKE0_9ENTR|nr:DUF2778 domain-containing protein [Siccibacter turicensis]MDY0971762.1 DUF2778 domain-containing protein [Siccibacter turicensis]PSN07538.1 hypothetical protein C7G83_10380 [Siccibacter turicensis]